MPINFTCPHCSKNMQVDDAYAGQSGPCAGCGQTITIPGPAKPMASGPMDMPPPKPGLPPMAGPAGYGQQFPGQQFPGQQFPGQPYGNFAPPAQSSSAGLYVVVALVSVVVLLFGAGILVALLLPAVQAARGAARRAQSMNNMKQIVLALHNYEAQYQSFPPAFVADANGKPLYSWRVLILPYLGDPVAASASQRFDMSKAWDSPENRAISDMMVPIFHSPNDVTGTCSYMALAGPNTMFSGEKGTRLSQIADGTANSIALVEVFGRQQSWAEPKDVDVTAVPILVGRSPGQVPGTGGASTVVIAAMGDGSVRAFPMSDPGIEPHVRAMSTINGGEIVP